MNYQELVSAVSQTTEKDFRIDDMNTFIRQAEQKIYQTVQFPALRENSISTMDSGVPYLGVPDDFLWAYSLAVTDNNGRVRFLLDKDVNYIRAAYPDPNYQALPKHYGLFDETCFILGPTPDRGYLVELHYGHYPESIVTANNSWLGDNFDPALFNATLVQAARYLKAEPDIVENYNRQYIESLIQLRNFTDGKLREDKFRSGQFRLTDLQLQPAAAASAPAPPPPGVSVSG